MFVEDTAVYMTSSDSVKGMSWWTIYSWFKNFNDVACTEVMSTYILN